MNNNIKNKIMVLSGKGGVGKSTVSVNLATALAEEGFKVGLMDIDVHGPNVAKMLGIGDKKLEATSKETILPIEVFPNLSAVSIANLIDLSQPVIWRGPLKHKMIEQFVKDVEWGDLDYLIVDSPPGTGDEPMSALQVIGDMDGAIIVTTPQGVSTMDAMRSAVFVQKLNSQVLGIVENMSYFVCPNCGQRTYLFGEGGGESLAKEIETDLITRIPQNPELMRLSEDGKPACLYMRGTEMEAVFKELAGYVIKKLKDKKEEDKPNG
ncbi:MAG: Mrp/NBP35 family ATP-binding protein [Thermotogota bacterium]|nr:Mrp/NBP35 family ATP-binding protein [Thermotogota bacterium]